MYEFGSKHVPLLLKPPISHPIPQNTPHPERLGNFKAGYKVEISESYTDDSYEILSKAENNPHNTDRPSDLKISPERHKLMK